MNRILALVLSLSLASSAALDGSESASLRGSASAMREQNQVAQEHGLSFLTSVDQVQRAIDRGELVELEGNADYQVAQAVRHPYTVPAVRTFVERLGAAYRDACGQPMVVTSAVRPKTKQPRNAHALSVHPAGMAVDLRVSDQASCREWIEGEILRLRALGVIHGIREYNPPHYHVAIYPEPYLAMVEAEDAEAKAQAASRAADRWRAVSALPAPAPSLSASPAPAADGGSGVSPLGRLSLTMLVGAVGGGLLVGVRLPGRPAALLSVRRALSGAGALRQKLLRRAGARLASAE